MKKFKLFSLLAAALFCASTVVAQNFYFSPYVENPNSDITKLITADGSASINITTTGGANTTSRDLSPTPTSIVDGKTQITATATHNKLGASQTIKFTTTAQADIKVLFCVSSTSSCSLTLTEDATNNTLVTVAGTGTKLVPLVLSATDCEAGAYTITAVSKEMYIFEILVAYAAAIDDATLSEITIGGKVLEEFDPETLSYDVILPYGTTEVPVVAATATSSKAQFTIDQATATDGTATIHVTAEDGITTQDYTIHFSVATSLSTDATLSNLLLDGKAIAGFDAETLDYEYEIAYSQAIPVVSAELNDATATLEITQATEVPGTASVVVTAQDGITTKTYTIAISRADAIAHLTVVPFTNGAKGAIDEVNLTITAPYLAGTEVPTVKEEDIEVSGDGAPTATLNNDGTITLVGDDGKSSTYEVKVQVLAAADLGNDLITFTGEETYIFAPYGWASDKGWKFAKNVNEEGEMRDAKGNTRIYIALPPAESVALTSGSGANRKVTITVNGTVSEVTQTAASGSAINLTLNQNADNFVVIESSQTSGDGGFTKLQLTGAQKPISTAFEAATEVAPATKVVRNGQLLIIRDGKTYNAQGAVIE